MKKNTAGPNKRNLLISAIVNVDMHQLQLLNGQCEGKRLVVLDSFFDCLKFYSIESNADNAVVIESDEYKKMWEGIKKRLKAIAD